MISTHYTQVTGPLLAVAVLCVVSIAGCLSDEATNGTLPPESEPPPCVRIMTVESAMVRDQIELRANLMAHRQTAILPRNGGWVSQILVDEGDPVQGNETLMATIRMEAIDLNVDVAEAGTEAARAAQRQAELQLENARSELARVEMLHQRGAASDQQLEQVQTMVATLEEMVRQAEAQVRMLRTQIRQAENLASDSEVIAPFDGIVAHRLIEVGQLITNFPPTPLFVVIDPTQIRVIANVPERHVHRVREGSPVTIVLPSGDETEAALTHISPDLDLVSRTLRVWALIDNPEGRLRHGGSAVLKIDLGQSTRPILPRHVISRVEGDRGYLFALNSDGRSVREIAVPLGPLQDEYYPVLGEIEAGELIVEYGWPHLSEGMAVRVANGEACGDVEE